MEEHARKLKQLEWQWMALYHKAVSKLLKEEHIVVMFHDAPSVVELPIKDLLVKVAETALKIGQEVQGRKDLQ
jgi:hypothetical protein